MNGLDTDYGVSYRTLQKMFQLLEFKQIQSKVVHSRTATLLSAENSCISEENAESNPLETSKDIPSYEFKYSIHVSMMEIYNEQVKDLLVPSASSNAPSAALDVRLSPEGEVFVQGLSKHKVDSIQEVFGLFEKGSSNRATAATNLNEHSSRSHSILLVEVTSSSASSSNVSVGKLYLIDLAGSERVRKSGVTGAAMKEAQNINRSLSALGDVMEALDNKSKHIPYRNSALTFLLQNSLGGNARTMMLVTVCPTDLTSEESLFTLQFASRVRNIQLGPARKNVNSSIKNMEDQISSLRSELKETKRKKQSLEDTISDLKKDKKKESDKTNIQADNKLRQYEESRKTAESVIAQLQKANADFTVKLQKERETKSNLLVETEKHQKLAKKAQDQLNAVNKEKEELIFTVYIIF